MAYGIPYSISHFCGARATAERQPLAYVQGYAQVARRSAFIAIKFLPVFQTIFPANAHYVFFSLEISERLFLLQQAYKVSIKKRPD